MAYAHVDLVATAGQQNFPFDIEYLSRDNISVFQEGVLLDAADWTFLMAQVIRLDTGATEGDVIRVKRVTPIDEPIVDYSNGSVLGEADLDATALQSLFAAQEVADSLEGAITQNDFLQWDAQGLPLVNLGDPRPAEPLDATNLGTLETIATDAEDARDAAIAAKVLAQTAQAAAELAESHAETAETNAETAETNAENAEANAELAETAAEAAQAAAAASQAAAAASASAASSSATTATTQAGLATTAKQNAETAEANAETAETNAETAETNAAASASAASGSAASASTHASNASSSASAASASAVTAAALAAQLVGTSTTSRLIEVASKVFTTQSGKFFAAGTWLLITSDANTANYMHGQVTSYSGTTLTVNVTNIGGSGTLADWTIRVAGTRGAQGAQGDQGLQGDPGEVSAAELATAISDHAGLSDPHAGYQKESEKNVANGYVGMNASTWVEDDTVAETSIIDGSVTKAKLRDLDATSKLLGSSDADEAVVEITLGTGLEMDGTTLNATATGGGDSLIYEFW